MRTLGVGTYARVVLARHQKDRNYYAVKVLKKAKVRQQLTVNYIGPVENAGVENQAGAKTQEWKMQQDVL